jgi:hypothetical protein
MIISRQAHALQEQDAWLLVLLLLVVLLVLVLVRGWETPPSLAPQQPAHQTCT